MTRHYGSQSMVAPLRTVLVKRPDAAFAVEDPLAWHYSNRPDLAIAQQEHDALVNLLRQDGAEVLYHDEPQPNHADANDQHRRSSHRRDLPVPARSPFLAGAAAPRFPADRSS